MLKNTKVEKEHREIFFLICIFTVLRVLMYSLPFTRFTHKQRSVESSSMPRAKQQTCKQLDVRAIFQWSLPSQRPKDKYVSTTLLLGKSKDGESVNI